MKITDKVVLFWNGTFSNWERSPFKFEGREFNCGEQYMMYKKAEWFDDERVMHLVMKTDDPGTQKKLGREIKNFDPVEWERVCVDVMVDGLREKFLQNPTMLKELMETGTRVIAEASPVDKVWGIGLAEDDPNAEDQSKWDGKNYLGVTLMEVRRLLNEK